MPTVGSLAYSIVARHGELTAGISASRAELRTLKDAFLATQTPVERFSMAIEHLQRQAEKFPDKANQINRAIAQMRQEMEALSAVKQPDFVANLGRGSTFAMGQDLHAAAESDFMKRADFMDKLRANSIQLEFQENKRMLSERRAAQENVQAWMARVRANSAVLEQQENLRLAAERRSKAERDFIAAQKPLIQDTGLLSVRMSKLQLVLDPISLAFRALHAGMDLARQGMQALEQIAARVSERMRDLDALAKKAGVLGIDPEALVGLRGAAQGIGGVGADQLDAGLTNFSQRLAEAATTGKGATEALTRLGLKAQDLVQLSADRAFLRVADAISNVQNPSERLRLAFELLGKQGREMATVLAAGGEKIRELAERQRELSQIDWINLDNIQQANDKLEELKTVFTGIIDVLASELSPLIKDVAGDMVDGFSEATNKGEGLRDVIQQIALALSTAVDGVKNLNSSFSSVGGLGGAASGLAGTSAHGRAIGQAGTLLQLLQALEMADPESHTARTFEAQMAAPIGMHAEFRQPQTTRDPIDAAERADQGRLTVGRPPGEAAFERITKEREELIKLEEKRAQTEMRMWQERQDAARQVMLDTRTDAEKINQRQAELRGLPLDDDTRRRALEGLHDELVDIKNKTAFTGPQTIGGIRAGSVEALRAQFQPRSIEEKMLKTEEKQQKELELATALLGQIKDEIANIGLGEAP